MEKIIQFHNKVYISFQLLLFADVVYKFQFMNQFEIKINP